MTLPVLWVSRHEDVLARGTWDGGMIEALFDGSLWRVPGGFTFAHHEHVGDAELAPPSGAVVVVSGRNHSRAADVAWLNRGLVRMEWALLIIAGDEEAAFPVDRILGPDRFAIWAMGAKEPHPQVDWPLGSGWPPWFRDALPDEMPAKLLDFSFAGQITHERRYAAAAEMDAWEGLCSLIKSAGFTQGLPPEQYADRLAEAKVAPCPSGPESPDSFRLYEALEAGCVPLADAATPHGPEPGYWTHVFGEPPPFPEVHDWAAFPALMDQVLKDWPEKQLEVFSFWQEWKRALAWRFTNTLRRLSQQQPALTPDEEITVIIPTSPTPLHPALDHITEVVSSVREQLPNAEILIGCDGVRPEQRPLRDAYYEYLQRLLWATNRPGCRNVLPVVRGSWGHQANVARMLLDRVRTPLVLFVEHDTPIYGDIPWGQLAATVHAGVANVIRLAHESSILPDHRHLMLDSKPRLLACEDGLPPALGMPTVQWSQRPALSPTLWYRDLLDKYFAPDSRSFIEDVLHGIVQQDWNTHGVAGWERWRLWIYHPEGDIKRSWHLDSRGEEQKYDQRFRYPNRVRPPGAPPETLG